MGNENASPGNGHSVQPPPESRCAIGGCNAAATTKWWARSGTFFIELCDKHSQVASKVVDEWPSAPTYHRMKISYRRLDGGEDHV